MSELVIEQVDARDDAGLAAWHAAYDAGLRYGRDPRAVTAWTLREVTAALRDASDRKLVQTWSGRIDGEVVVTGTLEASNLDNLQNAELFVTTRPDRRGHGYGSALLHRLEQVLADRGRRVLSSELSWPYDDPTGAASPDVAWAAARGYAIGLVDVQRQLTVPVDDDLLRRLAQDAAAYHDGYELRSFVGAVPEELLAGWVALSSSLMTEAPLGDLEREPEAVDLGAYRQGEALVAAQGRTKFSTGAIAPDGEVVAYTDVAVSGEEPGKAYQWGTLVRRDHRGHRLGMAVKLANLRQLQEQAPEVDRVVTWNAEVNAHMIGVNELLGFVPTERLGEVQKRLS